MAIENLSIFFNAKSLDISVLLHLLTFISIKMNMQRFKILEKLEAIKENFYKNVHNKEIRMKTYFLTWPTCALIFNLQKVAIHQSHLFIPFQINFIHLHNSSASVYT